MASRLALTGEYSDRGYSISILTCLSPLAGGFLTRKVSLATPETDLSGGRWVAGGHPAYPDTFDKPSVHAAMRKFCKICAEKRMSSTEASLRWIMHHSVLGEGDGIILGASRVDQLRGNVQFCRKGPLDEELVKAVEEMWETVKDDTYWG
jgi:aflatoxin B1 aldehyde reductase